jgi:WD40 repeat protein
MKLSYLHSHDPEFLKIKSMDCSPDGRRLILGTLDSRIMEMVSTDLNLSQNSKYTKSDINKGPFTPDSVDRYEMWGLAVFRSPEKRDRFITCSDNGLVEVWSTKKLTRMSCLSLKPTESNSALTKPGDGKLRSLAISAGEEVALVGCDSGLIQVP